MDGPCRIHLMPVAPHPVSPRGFNSCHHNCLAPQGCLTAHAHSVRPPSPIEWSISPHHRLPSGGLWGVRFVMLQPRLPSGAASQQLLCRYYNPVTSESRTSSRCASAMHCRKPGNPRLRRPHALSPIECIWRGLCHSASCVGRQQ